jgi:hypothetical protein
LRYRSTLPDISVSNSDTSDTRKINRTKSIVYAEAGAGNFYHAALFWCPGKIVHHQLAILISGKR